MQMWHINKDIVIADDNALLRDMLAEIFLGYGWCVRTAQDGFTALDMRRDSVPHLILSDLEMDGMSGFELLSIVRRRFPSVRVIAMSGAYSGETVPTGVAADAFYAKADGSVAKLLDIVVELAEVAALESIRSDDPFWLSALPILQPPVRSLGVSCLHCMQVVCFLPVGSLLRYQDVSCPHCHSLVRVKVECSRAGGDLNLPTVASTQKSVSEGSFSAELRPSHVRSQVGSPC